MAKLNPISAMGNLPGMGAITKPVNSLMGHIPGVNSMMNRVPGLNTQQPTPNPIAPSPTVSQGFGMPMPMAKGFGGIVNPNRQYQLGNMNGQPIGGNAQEINQGGTGMEPTEQLKRIMMGMRF